MFCGRSEGARKRGDEATRRRDNEKPNHRETEATEQRAQRAHLFSYSPAYLSRATPETSGHQYQSRLETARWDERRDGGVVGRWTGGVRDETRRFRYPDYLLATRYSLPSLATDHGPRTTG